MSIIRTRLFAVVFLAAAGTALAGCGGSSEPATNSTSRSGTAPTKASSTSGGSTTLTVFAAASLTQTFTELGKDFEAAHPGVKVQFSFAGSSTLAEQINQGAPADVFASADEKNMKKVTADNMMAGTPTIFVRNLLTIVVPIGNPAHINDFASLAGPGVQVVVCAPQVPCGSATQKVEKKAKVTLKPVSQESNVTDVLAKVSSGDADAGLVYVTDAKGADHTKVEQIDIPDAINAINNYPIGVVKGSKNASVAQEFVDLVLGAKGKAVMAAAGFMPPA